MNANIGPLILGTYNSIFSDAEGSERRVSGTAPGTPIVMSIKKQPYVDTKTKVSGKRTVLRIDKHVAVETGGAISPISAYLVVAVPNGAAVATNDVLNVVQDIVRVVGNQAIGDQLGLAQAIFVTGEQ